MLLLTGFNTCQYLLARGHLKYADVFDGQVTVEPTRSRNSCLVVRRGPEDALLVKQPVSEFSGRPATLEREATCYWLANHDPDFEPLAETMPTFHHYDQHNHVLIVDYLSNTQSLETMFRRLGDVPVPIARSQARLLRSFHDPIFAACHDKPSAELFPAAPPSALRQFGVQRQSPNPSNAAAELVMARVGREPELGEQVDALARNWRPSAFIHGDVKASNCLVTADATGSEDVHIRLIDWELADMGDPLWDAASAIASYLIVWLRSVDLERQRGIGAPPAAELRISSQTVDAIDAFWLEYSAGRSEAPGAGVAERVGRYAALSLLYRFFTAANLDADELSAADDVYIDFAIRLFGDPLSILEVLAS